MRHLSSCVLLTSMLVLGACADTASVAVERPAPTPTPSSTTTTTTPVTSTSTSTTAPAAPATPAPATSPSELATRIAGAEATVRDPAADQSAVTTASFDLQLAYRQLGRTPEWEPEVLAAVDPALHLSLKLNTEARRQFRSMHRTLSDSLPAWRIIEPEPAEVLLAHYRDAQEVFGVPWEILAAVNLVETGMGRIRGTSVAGAEGPMQFMPATWAAFGDGGDINDTRDAIFGAARYLAHNGGGRGDIDNALWNYNHSDRYVEGVKAYAAIMTEDPTMFRAFHQFQIVYLSTIGDIWLPTGYEQAERIAAVDYVAARPDHHVGTDTR